MKFWTIEDAVGLAKIDHKALPDLDDLMLDLMAVPEVVESNTERWEDQFGWGEFLDEDHPTRLAHAERGELRIGWYRTNPCNCGEEHTFDMAEVPTGEDGAPIGSAARGAFMGVFIA